MFLKHYFSNLQEADNCEFLNFGNVDTSTPKAFSYIKDAKYLNTLNANQNIVCVVCRKEISSKISSKIKTIIQDDPTSFFYSAFVQYAKTKTHPASLISKDAIVHKNAFVAECGVEIESGAIIEEGATIKSGVKIGKNSIVRSGAVVGGDGFETKLIYGTNTLIPHDGYVFIAQNVDIGYNTCIDKGIFGKNTIIEEGVKIDNLCHIAHAVQIGANSVVIANATICGSCFIGKNVRIGPACNISNGVSIGDNAKITIGSTVVKDVPSNQTFTGYFAREHRSYLRLHFKKN